MKKEKLGFSLEMPYAKRQLIVVVDDHVVEAERAARSSTGGESNKVDWTEDLLPYIPAIVLGIKIVKAIRDMRANVLSVSRSESAALQFPPGHPRDRVIYAGHPVVRDIYYPVAQFHQLTLEHKLSEAIELLMALGAIEINVEHQSGWGREFSARLDVPEPIKINVGGGVEKQQRLLFQISLDLEGNTDPSVPDELDWYSHEPTWQQVARSRIKYGLKSSSLRLRYEDDFGINADLPVMVKKLKLDLGGKFENHKSTIWNIQVKWGSKASRSDKG